MAIKMSDGTFACPICGIKHAKEIDAETCKNSHEMLYIPITKTELNRLINGILLENFKLIPESLIDTLMKYQRANFRS
jgi:hypothetical protein